MNSTTVKITPRRSLTFFALLSLFIVTFSYAFALFIGAACVYLPYLALSKLERVPSELFLLLLGGIVLAATILWSLLPRWEKFEAPGMLLGRAEHPRLFGELEHIAETHKQPLPKKVYLVLGVTAFVADRGGILGFGNRRILGIGLPMLSILTVSELRATLIGVSEANVGI